MIQKIIKENLLVVSIIIAGVLIAGAIGYSSYTKNYSKSPESTSSKEEGLSSQKVAENVIKYINDNLLNGRATASLVGIAEDYGLYKITIDVQGTQIDTYATRDGKILFPEAINLTETEPAAEETGSTIGDFSVSGDEICKENGKPVVYFFGSKNCPHCAWEHPIMEKVAAEFKDEISFHNNMDSQADSEVFKKYSDGGIPTLVLGCKYYRLGSGERGGEEEEEKNLSAIICKLTGNKPESVCGPLQNLISQIKD